MTPFKKILVPVDFSTHSAEATRVAADLASRYGATLTLVHVQQPLVDVAPDSYLMYLGAHLPELLAELEKSLDKAKNEAIAAGAKQVDTRLLQGVPFAQLVEFARSGNYDLVVMGTHGRTGMAHLLIGSVAEKVVRKAPCAVLTVRSAQQKFEHP